jgi:hypothetical protein
MSLKILVVPDLQVKPGLKLDHVTHISKYIRDKKPDVVVQIGDLWDFPSLSSYDKGKKSAEGRRVDADFEAGCRAVELLMEHVKRRQPRGTLAARGRDVTRTRRHPTRPDCVPDRPRLGGASVPQGGAHRRRGVRTFFPEEQSRPSHRR